MESNEYADLQRTAERAEAAPWVEFPPTPLWFPPAAGAWAAAMTWCLADLDGFVSLLVIAALVVTEVGFLAWYRRYRGTMPSGLPPAEMRGAAATYTVVLVVLVPVLIGLSHLFATWVPVLVAFVVVTWLQAWYERAYATGADRARARLS